MERVNLSELIIPNLYLHYYSEMLTLILSSYHDFHYKFRICQRQRTVRGGKYIDELMAYQIEGLIVLSHTLLLKNWFTRSRSLPLSAKPNISVA